MFVNFRPSAIILSFTQFRKNYAKLLRKISFSLHLKGERVAARWQAASDS